MKKLTRFFSAILLITVVLARSMPAVSAPTPASIPANVLGISMGAILRPTENWGTDVINYKQAAGANSLSVLNYYLGWLDGDTSSSHVYNTHLLDLVRNATQPNYPAIMITWQPLGGQVSAGCSKNYGPSQVIPYPDILSGSCDAYIRQFAIDLSARPERFLIRFANEMNVDASAWWPGHFGLGPDVYISAYRHVYNVFMDTQRAAGHVNAEWVWAPNYFSSPAVSWNLLHNYYPGDQYVDWIGLSGYNWHPWLNEPYRTFSQTFGEVDGSNVYYSSFLPGVLYDLACHYAKPQLIAEYGTVTDQTNLNLKTGWITDAVNRLPNYPFLRGAFWYNDILDSTGIDFRITNTPLGSVPPAYAPAYRTAISAPVYQKPLPSLKDATPPTTYCASNGVLSTTFKVTPSAHMTVRGGSFMVTLTGLFYASRPTVNIIPPSGVNITGQITTDELNPPWGKDQIQITVGSNVVNGQYTLQIQVNGASYPLTITVLDRVYSTWLPSINR